jgi:hypothetical protein
MGMCWSDMEDAMVNDTRYVQDSSEMKKLDYCDEILILPRIFLFLVVADSVEK